MRGRNSTCEICLIRSQSYDLNQFRFTIGRITLFISLSLYFSNSLVIDLTARSLTTVSSCAHNASRIGSTAVCWPPRAGPTLANYSVIANTTSSSYFLIKPIIMMQSTFKIGQQTVLDGIRVHESENDGQFMNIVDFGCHIVAVHLFLEQLKWIHVLHGF